MRHNHKSEILRAYLNQRINIHVQRAFLEQPSADGILRVFVNMSLTHDPRAPADVSDVSKVFNRLPRDPRITKLKLEQAELKVGLRRKYGTILWIKIGET